MAERGSNDKSNKTLRAYLVYDYIFKKSESDYFAVSSINAYLQTYGINCYNRAIVRDIEAINQAYIMSREELDDVEEANALLADKNNQLIYQNDDWRNMYRVNKHNYRSKDFAMIGFAISTTLSTRWLATKLVTARRLQDSSRATSANN